VPDVVGTEVDDEDVDDEVVDDEVDVDGVVEGALPDGDVVTDGCDPDVGGVGVGEVAPGPACVLEVGRDPAPEDVTVTTVVVTGTLVLAGSVVMDDRVVVGPATVDVVSIEVVAAGSTVSDRSGAGRIAMAPTPATSTNPLMNSAI
jgi:hypothetical protein